MKHVTAKIIVQLPLLEDAELVESPDGDDMDCLKIGDEYYIADFMLMKYIKDDDEWEEIEPEEILDETYKAEGNVQYVEIKEELDKLPE